MHGLDTLYRLLVRCNLLSNMSSALCEGTELESGIAAAEVRLAKARTGWLELEHKRYISEAVKCLSSEFSSMLCLKPGMSAIWRGREQSMLLRFFQAISPWRGGDPVYCR